MPLFGEKCARCGSRRTKQEYEGVPTCEACQEQLELKAQAADEEPRSCPIDATAMKKEIVANVIVDRCPGCGGVWLDGGELELLKGAVEAGVTSDLIRGLTYPVV